MQINGVFIKFIQRNEKTGYSSFLVRIGTNLQLCEGIVQYVAKNAPVSITGSFVQNRENRILKTTSIVLSGHDKTSTIKYLSGPQFFNAGEKTIEKLLGKTADDIFLYVRNGSEENNTSFTETECKIIEHIKSDIAFEQLHSLIVKAGGSYHSSIKLFHKYGVSAADVLYSNPYVLIQADTDYNICERLAAEYKIESCDKRRVRGIVRYAMNNNRGNGNTTIRFHELCKIIHNIEKKAGFGYYTEPLFIAEEIMSDSYVLEKRKDDIYVYLKDDYFAECQIVENIKRLSVSAVKYTETVSDVDCLQNNNIRYSKEQLEVINATSKSGVMILTGDPGTGKTTTISGIIKKYEYEHPKHKIILCAPTARAARRMNETTGKPALTIHKLLDIRPYENILSSGKKIEADCIIVDECSMIDTVLMARLLACAKNGAMVILSGDKNQLASVNPGNVFADMLESGVIKHYHLSNIYRQSKRSLIVENSKKVIEGDHNLETDRTFIIKRFKEEKDIVNYAVATVEKCMRKNISDFKIFTPARKSKFLCATINVNHAVKSITPYDMEASVSYGHNTFSVGDTIIFNKNNYDAGYVNGQDGIITDIQKHSGMCRIAIKSDDCLIQITGAELDDLDLGYALTAHKSQGGECEHAIIMVPKQPFSMLKRQLLYVEITRARKSIMILSEDDALEIAISNYGIIKRETGLLYKLKQIS